MVVALLRPLAVLLVTETLVLTVAAAAPVLLHNLQLEQ
jgi:hypothetical protein